MYITTLLLLAIPTIVAIEDDPHFFVYPNRPEHFLDPKPQRRSLLPFMKVRDLPMSGLVYLNRIKAIDNQDESSEEKEEKTIGEEIDNVLQTLKEKESSEDKTLDKKAVELKTESLLSSPFPQPNVPFPWERGLVQQESSQFALFNRVRSAPTQFVHQPVVGSAFVQSQYPQYPYGLIQPQQIPQVARDESSGDELTVVVPSLPIGYPVGQSPSSVQLLPVASRRVVHSGSPSLQPLDTPIRAHGVATQRGLTTDNKLVSISVFRLGH
ncbi:hypothetical protein PFISCL1PPCAC_19432 [Pristionchus fissidentatus]|uniref:Uncharacterized protein n=1 Tax=Pristionchus fissidentatus TaxID=1538716 RepID=A0AAV5WC02_9BILA|nr:hypothetical protein PFISCL1PPCAC_19432 [Pristionchus fissidentatus]